MPENIRFNLMLVNFENASKRNPNNFAKMLRHLITTIGVEQTRDIILEISLRGNFTHLLADRANELHREKGVQKVVTARDLSDMAPALSDKLEELL